METREYVECLLKNYNEILKDIEQLKYEYESYNDIEKDEVIESLNFSSNSGERIQTSSISDKTCKIALIYSEATKRMNKESKLEIYKMMKATEIEMARLNYCIERLEDRVKVVIKLIYIEHKPLYEVGGKLSIAERTVCKYRKIGVDKVISMFDINRLVVKH